MPVITITKANSVALDTYVSQANPSTSYGTSTTLSINGGTNISTRPLLKFDLGLVPNDAVINSATLNLFIRSAPNSARTIDVHNVLSTWANNATWATIPNFDSVRASSLAIAANQSGAVSIDVKTLVQGWVNGNLQQFGLLLKERDEATQTTAFSFGSLEDATASAQPQLTIDYTIPTTGKKQVEVLQGQDNFYNNVSSITPSIPTGAQVGDLVSFLISTSTGSANVISTPAGWTKQFDVFNSNNNYRYALFTKFIGAGEQNPTFSISSAAPWYVTSTIYKNVKSILLTKNQMHVGSVTSFNTTDTTVNVDNSVFVVLNEAPNASGIAGFTPALGYTETQDTLINSYVRREIAFHYMHKDRDQTAAEMKSTPSSTATTGGASVLMALEPVTNNSPTLTLTSPADNQTLAEGSTMAVQGSASDADSGNVVTIKYKINNGTTRALNSGVSNGSTPISFTKTLTYSNKRIWDGSTDVAGVDLAENTNHTLTVWSEDDQGGKSADVTRTFTVVWNRPPVISGANENLGTIMTPPIKNYSITEPESDAFTVTEKINGTVIRTFPGVAAQQEEITIPHDLWISLDLGVSHSLIVEATDSKGLTATRTYTFVRTETHLEFLLNFANPDVQAHFTPDGMPERILITLDRYIPEGADIESVKVTNNNLDATPAWEDATSAVEGGRGYLFTNQTKTAADWQINVWVIIAKGTATERVRLNGFGGAFD